MDRRWAKRLGVGLFISYSGLLAVIADVFSPQPVMDQFTTPANGVQLAAMLGAGLAYVLGGTTNALARAVGWQRLVGLGNVLLAIGLLLLGVFSEMEAPFETLALIGGIVASVGFVFLGADLLRGGRHVEPAEE